MNKSWMLTDRTSKTYMEGVKAFIAYAVSNLKKNRGKKIKIPCPCVYCLNHSDLPVDEVEGHLFSKGIDLNYTRWTKHGEADEQVGQNVFFHQEDVYHSFESEIPTDATQTVEMVKATEDNFKDEDFEKFHELLADAEKPLYEGCHNFTKVSAVVQLLNLKSKHGASDKFFNELLDLLKKMLPEGNALVKNTYEAKKILKLMGSGYKKIHACPNNCILYTKLYENLKECPNCSVSRWKVDEMTNKMYENVPAKVLWYFPIIPRFQRLFQVKTTAKDLTWHSTTSKKAGVLRHPSDSPAWLGIDERFPEIANDPRNLRLGISTDGVDVNRGNRNHSVWPVLNVIYNLPPWLCMKRKFIMLALLISGTPGNDIDVFLEPLIDDLALLFEVGVETYDAYAEERFTLRAVVLWTINDYPALGAVCGCPYSGFHGCVVCRKKTKSLRLPNSGKQSYTGHRRYLPYDHPFRKQKKGWDGKPEREAAPNPMTGEEIYNEQIHVINQWGKVSNDKQIGGKAPKQKRNAGNGDTYWKKFNIWNRRLRYWRHNPVQHCIDFMHTEKNVAESIIGTLLNIPGKTKDGLEARKDLAYLGIRKSLHEKTERGKTTLPAACYTLTKDEKNIFCETLYNLRVPQGYCSNFSSLVSLKDRKLLGMKSHDYHMLMQQFLPIAIRSIMYEPTRNAIIRLCFFSKLYVPRKLL